MHNNAGAAVIHSAFVVQEERGRLTTEAEQVQKPQREGREGKPRRHSGAGRNPF
jgi:hypothetical protein